MTTDTFPFSALVGQDDLRCALEANAVNPAIGGVLIRGEKGTAKSTAVRSLVGLLPQIEVVAGCPFSCDPDAPNPGCPAGPHPANPSREQRGVRLVELPVGASAERLTGSLDIRRALSEGVGAFEPGLLAAAHRGVLYVDEVNLLSDHLVDILLDAAALGVNYVEREGVSVAHPARFVLVGTMNPEEGELRPQLLDRFGLAVDVTATRDVKQRAEVVRRRLAYERDPRGFSNTHDRGERAITRRIASARDAIATTRLSDQAVQRIAAVCAELEVEGLRADIVCAKTATTLAALDGSAEVSHDHIRHAAALALSHRRRRGPFESPGLSESELDRALASDADDHDQASDGPPPTATAPDQAPRQTGDPTGPEDTFETGSAEPSDAPGGDRGSGPAAAQPQIDAAKPGFSAPVLRVEGAGRGGEGRRSRARGTELGHQVADTGYEPGACVAVGATLRTAAKRALRGDHTQRPVAVQPQDLRSAVCEGLQANLCVFVIDTSASMAARRRMAAVKGAVWALLTDTYRRRDRVAVIGFHDTDADVVCEPTNSPELAIDRLESLCTGGRTPIATGLDRAHGLIATERRRDPDRGALCVIVTDGRANSGAEDPIAASREAAGRLASSGTGCVIVDTEQGIVRLGLARRLAEAIAAPVLGLDDLERGDLQGFVQARTRLRRPA